MTKPTFFDFENCNISNDLWPIFINKIGVFNSKLAVSQARDLQRMQGNSTTIPVLIMETCGTALVNYEVVKINIGLRCIENGMILIYSKKLNSIQLLRDNYD